MKHIVSDIAFTPTVKAIQERLGSRAGYAKMGFFAYPLSCRARHERGRTKSLRAIKPSPSRQLLTERLR